MLNKLTINRAFSAICLTSVLVLSCGFSEQVLAQNALRQGFPGRRVGGGTRGGSCPANVPQLTALIPKNNLGLTVSAYPTFFFYIPQTPTPQVAEFVLLNENEQQIYQKSFTTTGSAEIINLNLSASTDLPPLAIGKNYHWYFSIICNPAKRNKDIFVEGWIQRVRLNPVLAIQLQKSSLTERATLYTSRGLWHDALGTLAQLRRDRPNDLAIVANWTKLLQSVGLGTITQEPLGEYQVSRPLITGVQSDSN